MKKTGILLLIFLSSIFCLAQNRIALVGGAHQSDILEINNLPGWIYNGSLPNWDAVNKKYASRTSFHAGFIAQLPFNENSNFFFNPGVVFYTKGNKFNFTSDTLALLKRNNLPDTLIKTKYNYGQKQYLAYIDIPFNILYKFSLGEKVKIVLGGGPYFSFFFNGSDNRTHEVIRISSSVEENNDLPVGNGKGQYTTLDYGVNGLVGFEFGRLFLTANYSRGLNSFYHSKEYEGKFIHEVIGATLGIFLGKSVD